MRVAFVGNSYTYFNDLPGTFTNLSAALHTPVVVEHQQVTPPGSSIFQHGNVSLQMGLDTLAMLQQSWDFVVLQDQSETPGGGRDTDSSLPPGVGKALSVAALSSFFLPALKSAGARAVLYSTWGRHDGDPPNADYGYGTFLGMNRKTAEGYQYYRNVLARGAGSGEPPLIVPCGRAYELTYNLSNASTSPSSLFSCLYHSNLPASTPRHCILDGAGKGGHPSPLGTYLIACTFAAAIHRQSPIGARWAPAGVSAAERDLMQRIAHQAVFAATSCQKRGGQCVGVPTPCCAGLVCDPTPGVQQCLPRRRGRHLRAR